MNKQFNKLKRRCQLAESMVKLTATKNADLLIRKVVDQSRVDTLKREIKELKTGKEHFPGFTNIELGKDHHMRGEVIAIRVIVRVDELLHDLMGSKAICLRDAVRHHSLTLVRELENAILAYAEKNKYV